MCYHIYMAKKKRVQDQTKFRAYHIEYEKENYRRYVLRFDRRKEPDVINRLDEKAESKTLSVYIRDLIRADLNKK